VIYDFALGCHRRVESRDLLVRSLTPLYLAKVAAFVHETWISSTRQAEERVEALCRAFLEEKPYLLEQWTAPAPIAFAAYQGGTS
jgi:hypothetical protein